MLIDIIMMMMMMMASSIVFGEIKLSTISATKLEERKETHK